jgi:hypothetical protein
MLVVSERLFSASPQVVINIIEQLAGRELLRFDTTLATVVLERNR